MKTPIRYVFVLFIVVFIYIYFSIETRLNELNKQISLTETERDENLNFLNRNDEFKLRKRTRLKKFKNFIDDNHNLDQFDSKNQNLNRSIWKQISFKPSFGYSHHQGI